MKKKWWVILIVGFLSLWFMAILAGSLITAVTGYEDVFEKAEKESVGIVMIEDVIFSSDDAVKKIAKDPSNWPRLFRANPKEIVVAVVFLISLFLVASYFYSAFMTEKTFEIISR